VGLGKRTANARLGSSAAWPRDARGELIYAPTRRRYKRRRRRESPEGYTNIKNPMNSGRFTRAAKAARAAERAAAAERWFDVVKARVDRREARTRRKLEAAGIKLKEPV
jgi:hypothetical protein